MPIRRVKRSLATQFFVFTLVLVLWVSFVLLSSGLTLRAMDLGTASLLVTLLIAVSASIALVTAHLLTMPLRYLQDGIRSIEEGRLEPIRVSSTGDEIEQLGQSFNRMVTALSDARREVQTYQQQMEQRIRERTAELESLVRHATAASQAKTEFLANISHELRTPMNGLIGMLDMALAADLAAEQRDQIETAHSCAFSLLALLNDILDLSKIEAGKISLDVIRFDIAESIREAVRVHGAVACRKGLAFRLNIDESVPRFTEADPLRLHQIIANLVSNAVKFTERGAVTVNVSYGLDEDQERNILSISVQDTGIGIPANKLVAVFEKFTQVDSSNRRFGGTGLGLTITQRLVDLHGGHIRVSSELGVGSSFTVELPYVAIAEPTPVRLSESIPAHVLVVDDNAVNRKVVTSILEKNGYTYATATQGAQALEMLDLQPFDLVLMDVQMPVLDGLQATRRIRTDARWRSLPIIAMTAHAMTGDQEACRQAGMNEYISKPVHAAHLLRTIAHCVERQREPSFPQAMVAAQS